MKTAVKDVAVIWKFSIGGIIACLAVILGTYAWRYRQYASVLQEWILKISKVMLMIPLDVAIITVLMNITETVVVCWAYAMYRWAVS